MFGLEFQHANVAFIYKTCNGKNKNKETMLLVIGKAKAGTSKTAKLIGPNWATAQSTPKSENSES